MRSGNPALRADTFLDAGSGALVRGDAGTMSLNGTVNKTALLLVVTLAGALFSWSQFSAALAAGNPGAAMPWVWGGAIGGFVVALVTIFKKEWSPFTAPLYAALEGLFLGAVSAMFELRYPGIVLQAVGLTFGTLAALLLAYRSGLVKATENFKLGVVAATGGIALLFAYRSGWIKATENFKLGVVAATGGIALVYLATIVLGFFGINIPMIHDNGIVGIGFSLFVVVIASLNLVLDFDFIETGVEKGAPKYMEWYGAFGLMVTLVWLYLEFLRLLSKLQSR